MRANTARVATAAVYAPVIHYEALEEKARTAFEVAKTVGTALAAPFVGLAFAVGLPLIGLAVLAWMVLRIPFVRNVALFLAAPFIGLAYALAFPFVGVAVLAWIALRPWIRNLGF
ncbi:MAG: hypothetical protein EPO20_16620 [Betaproteobacteria bacterium]|nr:MAG: hypothetical protein EPO20_16620 [Betaproteobacteria bacterium]